MAASLRCSLLGSAAALLLAATSLAQTVGDGSLIVTVAGVDHVLPAATLDSLVRDTVTAAFHGRSPRTYVGIDVARLLAHHGLEARGLRGRELARYVVFEADDGYRVVFGSGELDSSVTGRAVLLAREVDGGPLPPEEGVWRVVVPGDERGARWMRQVRRIRVVDLPIEGR